MNPSNKEDNEDFTFDSMFEKARKTSVFHVEMMKINITEGVLKLIDPKLISHKDLTDLVDNAVIDALRKLKERGFYSGEIDDPVENEKVDKFLGGMKRLFTDLRKEPLEGFPPDEVEEAETWEREQAARHKPNCNKHYSKPMGLLTPVLQCTCGADAKDVKKNG